MTDLEDAVERVLAGDASAFERIVDATSARLVRVSARMLGNVADAEDVVQDAYVKAYEALAAGSFDRRSKVETWLYRIVVNGTIDAKRKKKTRGTTTEDTDVVVAGGATPDETIALKELATWLGELPEDQQAALVMKVVEGMSSSEIASVMSTTEGAVEQKLVRARATLRDRRNT